MKKGLTLAALTDMKNRLERSVGEIGFLGIVVSLKMQTILKKALGDDVFIFPYGVPIGVNEFMPDDSALVVRNKELFCLLTGPYCALTIDEIERMTQAIKIKKE